MMESGMLSSQQIKSWAKEVGFQGCGIARARVLAEAETEFLHSVEHGYHAEMHYLERNVDGRFNPESLLPGCKSVIVVTYNYLTDPNRSPTSIGRPVTRGFRITTFW